MIDSTKNLYWRKDNPPIHSESSCSLARHFRFARVIAEAHGIPGGLFEKMCRDSIKGFHQERENDERHRFHGYCRGARDTYNGHGEPSLP